MSRIDNARISSPMLETASDFLQLGLRLGHDQLRTNQHLLEREALRNRSSQRLQSMHQTFRQFLAIARVVLKVGLVPLVDGEIKQRCQAASGRRPGK